MAVKGTKVIKVILVIYGLIFLIYWGLILLFIHPSITDFYRVEYPAEPFYVRAIGVMCMTIGLLLLFASRNPIKNILVINITIIHNIFMILFWLVSLLITEEMLRVIGWTGGWLLLIFNVVFLILLIVFYPKKD